MRISDWSSDVCSSDLHSTTFWRCIEAWGEHRPMIGLITAHPHPDRRPADFDPNAPCKHFIQSPAFAARYSKLPEADVFDQVVEYCRSNRGGPLGSAEVVLTDDNGEEHVFWFRSEEHTSELQSLMRISYAVFCLK